MDARIANLLAVYNLPGYRVVLDYFEGACAQLEKEVFDVNPGDPGLVIAAQRVAVGARWMLKRVTQQIQTDCEKAIDGQPRPMTKEEEAELYLKSLQ